VSGYRGSDAKERANMLTSELFELKAELGCTFILIHHMNRGIEHRADDTPILADLNEGGERDPDIVVFLHRPKEAIASGALIPTTLSITKHRGGPEGEVELLFNGPCTTFISAMTRTVSLGKE
jgi:replicative DNA helicase